MFQEDYLIPIIPKTGNSLQKKCMYLFRDLPNRHLRSDDLSLASRSKKDYLLPPSTLYTPPCALTSSLALDFVAQ